jgi:hypothetical protein
MIKRFFPKSFKDVSIPARARNHGIRAELIPWFILFWHHLFHAMLGQLGFYA